MQSKWLELEAHFLTTEMCLGELFKDHGTRANGRGIILFPADAQHTHNRRPETDAERKGINEWPAGTARGAGPGLGAGKDRERPRARPGEESGGESRGPAPPRSACGDSQTLRLGAEATELGARIWELENRVRRTSGRNHSPLPLPGCACLEPPPLSSFRRTHRTRVPASAALQPKMKSRHLPPARSAPFAAL